MNHLTLLLGATLALLSSRNVNLKLDEGVWESFKSQHGKVYPNGEVDSMRKSIFAYNKHVIDSFNAKSAEDAGFELGVNHLADHSSLDMQTLNGLVHPTDKLGRPKTLTNSPKAAAFLQSILDDDSIEVPDAVDWRKVEGRVTHVKNQGSCGSCWAFSAVGVLEGQEAIRSNYSSKPGKLVELSEQNLVDCVEKDFGCNGGFMKDALEFVHEENGIDDEISYPYKARTQTCMFDSSKVAFNDAGAAILPSGDEQKLKEVVAKFGPVAVGIDAGSIWFQFYRKGVYYNRFCHNKENQLNHGVLVVGYGTDPKKGDYWIVKNSWGSGYGEHGYIRMARNRNNNCGIATTATIPTF